MNNILENIRLQLGKMNGEIIIDIGNGKENWFRIDNEFYSGSWDSSGEIYRVMKRLLEGDQELVLQWTNKEYMIFFKNVFNEFRPGNIPWKYVHVSHYKYKIEDGEGYLIVDGLLESYARMIVEAVNERVLKTMPEFLKKKKNEKENK